MPLSPVSLNPLPRSAEALKPLASLSASPPTRLGSPLPLAHKQPMRHCQTARPQTNAPCFFARMSSPHSAWRCRTGSAVFLHCRRTVHQSVSVHPTPHLRSHPPKHPSAPALHPAPTPLPPASALQRHKRVPLPLRSTGEGVCRCVGGEAWPHALCSCALACLPPPRSTDPACPALPPLQALALALLCTTVGPTLTSSPTNGPSPRVCLLVFHCFARCASLIRRPPPAAQLSGGRRCGRPPCVSSRPSPVPACVLPALPD